MCTSCAHNNTKIIDSYFAPYKGLQFKKIDLEHLPSTPFHQGRYNMENPKNYTIINLIGFECNNCVNKLKKWDDFISKSRNRKKFNVIFLANGDTAEYFNYEIKKNNFSCPIFWDKNMNFFVKNDLLQYGKETYIINNKHEVVLFGDILNDKSLLNLL